MLRTPFVIGIVVGFIFTTSGTTSASDLAPSLHKADLLKVELEAGSPPDSGETAPPAKTYLSATVLHMGSVWDSLSPSQREMVDLMAADFFETDFSLMQRQRIGGLTARAYGTAAMTGRAAMRRARRIFYDTLSEAQRRKLVNVVAPLYLHLNDRQKEPFRRHAMEMLELKFDAAKLAQDAGDSI